MTNISQMFRSGDVMDYPYSLADTMRITRSLSTGAARFTAAIKQVMPIVLTPCFRRCVDRWGHRMHWIKSTTSFYILVFSLLAYAEVDALVPSFLGSLALATNVLPWIASVPVLAPAPARRGIRDLQVSP